MNSDETKTDLVRAILLDKHCMVGSNPDAPLEKICYCGWRGVGLLQHSQHAADERVKEAVALLTDWERETRLECANFVSKICEHGDVIANAIRAWAELSRPAEKGKADGTTG